jgi:DNA-binding transcriptional LysR family regulator
MTAFSPLRAEDRKTLEQLRVFAAVAEQRQVTRPAEAVNLALSAVS